MSENLPEVPQKRDLIESMVWGSIFIWAGLVYLAYNLGWLNRLLDSSRLGGLFSNFHLDLWGFIMLGAGIILLIGVMVRRFVPEYTRPGNGGLILAAVLIGVGLSNLFAWNVIWPVILIAIGIGMLLRTR